MTSISFFRMFGYSGITSLHGLEKWFTEANHPVSLDFHETFTYCSDLTDISALAGWDVNYLVNNGGTSIPGWHYFAYSGVTSLHGLEDWDVSRLTSLNGLFRNMQSLEDISAIEGWNVSNVTDMGTIFEGDASIDSLSPIINWDVRNVTSFSSAFRNVPNNSNFSFTLLPGSIETNSGTYVPNS